MQTPHSPAPWTANGTRVSASDGAEVADICPQQDTQLFDANRHLITASPLMLEALREAEFLIEQVLNHQGVTLNIIRSTIRKATGA